MPLSEQEQRLLDEMERHLMGKDADVVTAPREGQTLNYRNLVYGAVLVLLGIGGVLIGVSSGLIVVGVLGFVVMVAGAVLAFAPGRGAGRAAAATPRGATPPRPSSSSSFMDRMNDRWDRRHDER